MVTKEITLRLEESIHLKLHKYVKHPDNSVKIMLKNGSYGRQLMRLLPFSSSTYGVLWHFCLDGYASAETRTWETHLVSCLLNI